MDDEFTAVFPSNCQPDIFPNNTASHYYTVLPNPRVLHGVGWSVAVTDISYVHNIQTITDESLIVGEVDNPQLTFPYLEHANALVTYDMRAHEQEWITETRRSLYDWLNVVGKKGPTAETTRYRNEDHIYALLNILNRIGKNLWYWSYRENKICFEYTCTLNDVVYAFHLSDALQKVLHMSKQLFVPHPHFKVFPQTDVQMFESTNKALNCLSQPIDHSVKWEPTKFQVTLLPLHRMKKVVVRLPSSTLTNFIALVVSKMEKYGLTVRRTTAGSDAKLTWVYKCHFTDKKQAVAFIHFNQAMEDQLECYHSMVWNPIKFEGRVKSKTIEGAAMTVYLKEVTPPSYKLESWTPISEIKLPSKYYSTTHDMIQVLNNRHITAHNYTFTFNKQVNRFVLNVQHRCVVKISHRLKTILGFDKTVFFNETYQARRAPLLDKNIHHFYLYTNIVQPSLVGGEEVPLLRYIPITNAEFGQTVFMEWQNPTYLPVTVSELRQVELALYDDTGQPIHFSDGRTVVTLHFKRFKQKSRS